MAALDAGVFNSKIFAFVVGESQKAFRVHSAAIAKQSKALDVLMNGNMAEASNGRAIFMDTEEGTFARFCQFAYNGDYFPPEFIHKAVAEPPDVSSSVAISHGASWTGNDISITTEPAPPPPPFPPPFPVGYGFGGLKPKTPQKSKDLSKSRLLRQSLDDQVYNIESVQASFSARCEVRQNSSPTEDYTTVLLGHAQLYVFAEKWDIQALRNLALFKLHKTLVSFTLYAPRRRDIVELLRYAYSDETPPGRDGAVDDLRSLVMLYTACEVENLVHCPEFMSLIGEGDELAQDLVKLMIKRI